GVAVEEGGITALQSLQGIGLDVSLRIDGTFLDTIQQHIYRYLHINDQFRSRCIDGQVSINRSAEGGLVTAQVQLAEQSIHVNQEVRDTHRFKQVILPQLLHLACALKQKEQLRGQGILPGVMIETLKKRIVLGLLEQGLVVEGGSQTLGQTGLAHANGT